MLEACFFNSFVGQRAQSRLEAVVLDALPTKPGEEQLDSVLGKLQVIEKGKLVKFVGVGPDACFHVVLKLVQTIKDKRAPVWPATSTPFMDKVKARLTLLCSVSKAGDASSKMVVLHGEAAALHIYTVVVANKTVGTDGGIILQAPFQALLSSGVTGYDDGTLPPADAGVRPDASASDAAVSDAGARAASTAVPGPLPKSSRLRG
jgi:hypothetical protein